MEKARMERLDSIDKLGVAKCPYCQEVVNIIKKEVLVVEADKSPSDKPVWCESFRETQYVLSVEKQAAKNKIAELEKELAELKQQMTQHREYIVALKESIMLVNEEHSKLIGNYMNEMLKLANARFSQ